VTKFDAWLISRPLKKAPNIEIVEDESTAQLRITKEDGQFAVASRALGTLDRGIDDTKLVSQRIEQWADWHILFSAINPRSELSVDLSLTTGEDRRPVLTTRPGVLLDFRLTNMSTRPLYLKTVVLSTNGEIDILPGPPGPIGPGKSAEQLLGTLLPDDLSEITDHIKVLATDRPIALKHVSQVRSGMLFTELRNVAWTTAQSSLTIRRPTTKVTSFSVLLAKDDRSDVVLGEVDRVSICEESGQISCVVGKPLDRDGSIVVIDRIFSQTTYDDLSPGQAFEMAYELREELDVQRVEPLFEVPFRGAFRDDETLSGGSDKHDEAAANDRDWSLKYVRVPEAWQILRDRYGKKAGEEASGVRIAHLDTGYRHHPELFPPDSDILDPGSGLDLVDGGDPYDTLIVEGLLPSPGHGTASGSVIISPYGCQLKSAKKNAPCVVGTGPGAQLIPVRVHTSVVALHQRRLAEGIMAVVNDEIEGAPDIISIAMGGPPSWTLWRAVQKAEESGILIIAAAGNNVRTVVWPARFRSTIAVTAIGVRCKPWKAASRGARVDISAPGESVWRAFVDRDSGWTDAVGMGNGTTFATAITTGVAALWVSRHAGSEGFSRVIDSGAVTEMFRRALQQTAWRPAAGYPDKPGMHCEDDVGWPSNFGPGILDAAALLEAPLHTTSRRTETSDDLADLPLYRSLYPDTVDPEQVIRDFVGIFPSSEAVELALFEAEIMFLYSTSEIVGRSLDLTAEGNNSASDYARTRDALLQADLSPRLRSALETP
jgi:subtilisin family serine protease